MKKRPSNPFAHAFRGLQAAYLSERNVKIHLAAAALSVALGVWLELSMYEWLWISLSIALVFLSELLNTAMEALVDMVSPTYHPLARKAKDTAAAAVLVAAAFSLLVGGIIFIPKFWSIFAL
ncbi:undecaprenol kinase/diacylglycerol kinase (ATP) [Parapedobacter composti]|uniref:Undecaprenol kinase/diacylglycerol kinase (ATP) n=1 Tax=Parapedobacter composti TaxID=623281 RepID=A0A1I1FQ81_9SPHI|nr:diacylglycerol kinase family protein [Parapedobacter composti]SFC01162.1 undecaprenol kinase/diacylglycerol kinase (ATP) [Parapedobacter composti]